MSHITPPDHISKKRALLTLPGMERVHVRREEYAQSEAGPLTMDLYYPPGEGTDTPKAAVLFVTGYSDAGAHRMLGCKFRDMGAFDSWAQLVAASGLVGITYENSHPYDVDAALDFIRAHASHLGVAARRIGVWASSGHVPNALSLMMERGDDIRCAALLYGYTLDLDGATGVADMAAKVSFVTVGSEKTIENLPPDVPMIIVRAGNDEMPGLNDALDRFIAKASAARLPVTVLNHETGPHAFDLFDDTELTRDAIRSVLLFLKSHLDEPRG